MMLLLWGRMIFLASRWEGHKHLDYKIEETCHRMSICFAVVTAAVVVVGLPNPEQSLFANTNKPPKQRENHCASYHTFSPQHIMSVLLQHVKRAILNILPRLNNIIMHSSRTLAQAITKQSTHITIHHTHTYSLTQPSKTTSEAYSPSYNQSSIALNLPYYLHRKTYIQKPLEGQKRGLAATRTRGLSHVYLGTLSENWRLLGCEGLEAVFWADLTYSYH